ncbi:MAG TPA: substrate-binding domain-containing protein, partial [Promineifilum sp.]|nr:substrate-binding domain-containing protein [Promineifilum sp.]
MNDHQSPAESAPEPGPQPSDRFVDLYPSEDGIRAQVTRRQRVATSWRFVFLAATSLAVVILSTLLLSIINQSFGLVAEQTDIPEAQLVAGYYKSQLTGATNVTLSTEDDAAIAAGIAADANGIGLLGYALYTANQPALQALSIDGIAPSAETVTAGTYPLTRPLLLYSSAAILSDKPQVAAFLLYYLQHAEEVMSEQGAFPADAAALAEQAAALATMLGLDATTPIDPAAYEGDIVISGSSTLNPVTREVARRFRSEGFLGALKISSVGTVAGFEAFCAESADLVDASRPITTVESAACRANGLTPLSVQVGLDPMVVAVNSANTAVTNVTGQIMQRPLGVAELLPQRH